MFAMFWSTFGPRANDADSRELSAAWNASVGTNVSEVAEVCAAAGLVVGTRDRELEGAEKYWICGKMAGHSETNA
jgi:hypothetical protein